MATVTVAVNQVGVHNLALSAGVEEIVQFSEDVEEVEVVQITGASPVYFTTDGTAAAVPAAGAATACYSTIAALAPVALDPDTWTSTSIRLICAAAATVSVVRG